MRNLTDHIVEGGAAADIHIEVTDQPGKGGAYHSYAISGFHTKTNNSAEETMRDETIVRLFFQNGPIPEFGLNGVTQEALLTIVIDRLRSFQDGPFRCRENAIALTHCEEALMWLQKRTRDRIKRNVEGTHEI